MDRVERTVASVLLAAVASGSSEATLLNVLRVSASAVRGPGSIVVRYHRCYSWRCGCPTVLGYL